MTPSEALNSNRTAIRHIVESHRARNPQLLDPRLLDSGQSAAGVAASSGRVILRLFNVPRQGYDCVNYSHKRFKLCPEQQAGTSKNYQFD